MERRALLGSPSLSHFLAEQCSAFRDEVVDKPAERSHFSNVKSLLEIEEAIAKLPSESRRQLVQDIPALCPDAFPADGWDAILNDSATRPVLTSMLDKLDAESDRRFPK